jgi:hypothetical protein
VAGNLKDIYARLIPGAELEFRGSANAPSVLVDPLMIAGQGAATSTSSNRPPARSANWPSSFARRA